MKVKVEFYVVAVAIYNRKSMSGFIDNVLVLNAESVKNAKSAALLEYDDNTAKVLYVEHFKNVEIDFRPFTIDAVALLFEDEIKNYLAERQIIIHFTVDAVDTKVNLETKEITDNEESENNNEE